MTQAGNGQPESGHTHENPYAGQGPVLLDIGDDIGALVVEMPAAMEGVEVEIRATREHGAPRPHVAVVARTATETVVPSLVFPELAAGHYELYERSVGQVRLTATIDGGVVTQARWPGI